MKMPSRLVTSDTLNAGIRSSRRSIIGSARRSCRRTNPTPIASPARMEETARGEIPSWAISVMPKITASTATSNTAALAGSSRPASGARYSGSTRGPRMSSSAITGTASRNTEPHQKCSSSTPPSTGPIAPPAEKAVIHTPMAVERCLGSENMLKISDSVDGARVAQGAHGDHESRDHEPVDVGDPQQLRAAGSQVRAQRRHGKVQHGQVHRVEQGGEREHGEPGPLAPAGPWGIEGGHVLGFLVSGTHEHSPCRITLRSSG